MNYEEFLEKISEKNLTIEIKPDSEEKQYQLNNEALFHLPLIAMIILLFSKDRRKPYISELGQLVGECLEMSLEGFKGSSQHLGWSANLRVRTVKALTFLEAANLVKVNNRKERLQVTELGKKVINKSMEGDTNLAYNLAIIQRNYRNICIDRKLDMELE